MNADTGRLDMTQIQVEAVGQGLTGQHSVGQCHRALAYQYGVATL